jgi:hypothetical protein
MIQRPGIRAGEDMPNEPVQQQQSIKNMRSGIGNYTILRPGAKATSGVNRNIGFNRLSVINSENAGVVELGSKTLAKLFEIKIPDPTDVTWIAERDRLMAKYLADGMTKLEAELEVRTNKPLGREQRTITKRQNIGDSNLTVSNKIAELKEEVMEGRAESSSDQAAVYLELMKVFRGVRSIQAITVQEFNDLRRIAERAYLPSDRKMLGLDATYVDRAYYDENSGKINLLFIGKLLEFEQKSRGESKEYNMNLIVRDYSRGPKGSPDGFPAKTISSMYSAMSRGFPRRPRYLDLDNGGIISEEQLRVVAGTLPDGFNNPAFRIVAELVPIFKQSERPAPPVAPVVEPP